MQTALSGLATTQYREKDKIIPLILRSQEGASLAIEGLRGLNVFSQLSGRSVPLGEVAEINVVFEPAKIMRRNRLETVTVQAELLPSFTATPVIARLTPWLDSAQVSWKPLEKYQYGGEKEASYKANHAIAVQLPIAALAIFLILVLEFDSLLLPLIIFLTVPLGFIGVTFGLLINRSYFGFMTLLGIISLAGVQLKNAIVLLERVEMEQKEHGRTLPESIVEASQRRLRPILLTAAVAIGGLIPLWLFGGEMWRPMAIAIIFGLAFATVLTLGIVPVLYSLFFKADFTNWRSKEEV